MKFILFALAMQNVAHGITIRMGTTDNNRFAAGTPNPDFLYSTYDFSGVGWSAVDGRRSVTLISNQHFIAARHFNPGGNVRFYTNSGIKNFEVDFYTTIPNSVASGLPGNSDLVIGTLTDPIDLIAEGLTTYSVLDPAVNPVGLNSLLYGQRGRIGEGTIAGSIDFYPINFGDAIQVGSATGFVSFYNYNIASGNPNDAFLTSGDSGGPSFVVSNSGDLLLTGVHWAIGDNAVNEDGEPPIPATENYSFDTYVPAYVSQIEANVAGLTINVEAVPEPSSLVFTTTGICILLSRRRRAA